MQVEAELVELDKEEAAEFLASLGASEGGLSSLIKATYRQLGLLTYFTTGKISVVGESGRLFSRLAVRRSQCQQLSTHSARLPIASSTFVRPGSRSCSELGLGSVRNTGCCAGEKETRAWTITSGMTAPQAAGVIHSDFERGFIRAETVAYNDFSTNKGLPGCKEKGLLRLEGKEYVVQEGDIMNFRFSV